MTQTPLLGEGGGVPDSRSLNGVPRGLGTGTEPLTPLGSPHGTLPPVTAFKRRRAQGCQKCPIEFPRVHREAARTQEGSGVGMAGQLASVAPTEVWPSWTQSYLGSCGLLKVLQVTSRDP